MTCTLHSAHTSSLKVQIPAVLPEQHHVNLVLQNLHVPDIYASQRLGSSEKEEKSGVTQTTRMYIG